MGTLWGASVAVANARRNRCSIGWMDGNDLPLLAVVVVMCYNFYRKTLIHLHSQVVAPSPGIKGWTFYSNLLLGCTLCHVSAYWGLKIVALGVSYECVCGVPQRTSQASG